MRVIVDMPEDLVALADAEAKRLDRSRAWVIRDAVAQHITPRAAKIAHEFVPQARNALKCQGCGGKIGDHR